MRLFHSDVGPLEFQTKAPTLQGKPRPRKTLTELLPVTLPMELSAQSSCRAAVLEANVSGRLVPSATRVIAVISSGIPTQQPSNLAMSPTIAVTHPIIPSAQKKQGQPPPSLAGGVSAKIAFQKSARP
mmetsp:Transcript_23021/g.40514  ORF Transcript_23021/g.40514 Transcript_23021/m.40514 type:complete len:128 (-) Transcript_23021:621-1004(-)